MSSKKSPSDSSEAHDDPYKDIELYLEKAQEEIGQTFQNTRKESNSSVEQINRNGKSGEEKGLANNSSDSSVAEKINGIKKLLQLETILHGLSHGQKDDILNIRDGTTHSELTEGQKNSPFLSEEQGISVATKIAKLYNLPPLKQVESSDQKIDRNQVDDYGAHLATVISAGLSSNARRSKTSKETSQIHCLNETTESGGDNLSEDRRKAMASAPKTPTRKKQSDFVLTSRPTSSNLDLNALSTWASIFAEEMTTIANEDGMKKNSDDNNNNENPKINRWDDLKIKKERNGKSFYSQSSYADDSRNDDIKISTKNHKQRTTNMQKINGDSDVSESFIIEENKTSEKYDSISSQVESELDELLQIIENDELKYNLTQISDSLTIEENDSVFGGSCTLNDEQNDVINTKRSRVTLSQPSCKKFTFKINMTNDNDKFPFDNSNGFDFLSVDRSDQYSEKTPMKDAINSSSKVDSFKLDEGKKDTSSDLKNVSPVCQKDFKEASKETEKGTAIQSKENMDIADGLDRKNTSKIEIYANFSSDGETLNTAVPNNCESHKRGSDQLQVFSLQSTSSEDAPIIKSEEKTRSLSLTSASPSPSPLRPVDVQEFFKRVENSILGLSEKDPREIQEAFRNNLLLNPAFCNKPVQNVSTQTSPLISRSSSFLWISETDIAKQQSILLQSDAATCSVNSILSSCSSLEAFSEESVSENSCFDSDSSSSESETKKCDSSSTDRMTVNADTEFFRAMGGQKSRIDVSVMNEKLAGSDFEECAMEDCEFHFPLDGWACGSYRKGGHSVIPENEEIFDFTSGATIATCCKASENICLPCNKATCSSLPSRNNKSAIITLAISSGQLVRETQSESDIADSKIHTENKKSDELKKSCTDGKIAPKPPHQCHLLPLNLTGSSAPNSPVSSPLEDEACPPASASALSDASTIPMLYITSKSSSAPMLDIRFDKHRTQNSAPQSTPPAAAKLLSEELRNMKVIPPPRSQSVKELTELEAVEACKWLRAAGFPQYAQMFEDMQFPINITAVQKDHYFLDADSIQSLFRRLNALNRCARMRLDNIPRKSNADDSDEEEQIALSENWTFQRQSRRWSRISVSLDSNSASTNKNNFLISSNHANGQNHNSKATIPHSEDSVIKSSPKMPAEFDIPESPIPMDEDGSGGSASLGSLSASDKMEDSISSEARTGSFRRTSSERLRDGAKAFLRRMESLKTRRSKRRNREAVVISGPQVVDLDGMQRRMQNLACRDLTPPSSASPSPLLSHQRNLSNGHKVIFDDSSSVNSISDNSQTSTPTLQVKNYHWGIHSTAVSDLENGAFSDSECNSPLWHSSRDANSNETKLIDHYIQADKTNCIPNGVSGNSNHINFCTGSFNLGKESASYRQKFLERRRLKHNTTLFNADGTTGKRNSVYDNVPNLVSNKNHEGTSNCELSSDKKTDAKNTEEKAALHLGFYQDPHPSNSACTNHDVDSENQRISKCENTCSEDSSNCATTSQSQSLLNSNLNFQVNQQIQVPSLKRPRSNSTAQGLPLSKLSATQLMMLRKLSLLKLTSLMERYSPSNRSGWSWIMPKFMKRMKTPDYKDKVMFGVPLAIICQRTGHPLPPSIQAAIQFLRKNAMDSVGIFRKSGVRSRIQKLKNMCEANPNSMSYEGQQSYDVADMLKQYFRELPEALLTNKMSETFICIYQYIPEDLRHEALKAAIMLMPDENREVLHKLLSFLHDVSLQSHENQMTGSNLAVCFAPSLFHMNTPRSSSSSPRRRKTVGVPDQKELNENKAAHECLTHMIKEYKRLFSVPEDTMFQCRVSLSDDDESITLENLGQLTGNISSDWKSYVNNAMESLLKEAKEKSKNWVSVMTTENADISCKKIGDGNPLRQWKVSVEVEAPPIELLTRVLRERHIWDDQLSKWRVVSRLDNHSEIFQYVCDSMYPLPARDYCILRSWRTDLPKGACVLVETSMNHPDAPVPPNDVRGFVFLSRYLVEPCGSGKSRITHISRIDTKGRSPEWYNKIYGHISALHLIKIGESFQHSTEGPESKV